jgi:hypothetical protein
MYHLDCDSFKNFETWNVACWITSPFGLIDEAKQCKDHGYKRFVELMKDEEGSIGLQTPDGVKWDEARLDVDCLDEIVRRM